MVSPLHLITATASHGSAVAVIKGSGLTIELSNDISEGLLSRLLQEVTHA